MGTEKKSYEKTVVSVVNDIPAEKSDVVIDGIREHFAEHGTNFVLEGVGEYRRIVHIGRLSVGIRRSAQSFASGILYGMENQEQQGMGNLEQ